jgi:PEP-CTERM motif
MTMTTRKLLNAIVAATIAVMCSAAQARASAIQLNSPSDLSGGGTEVTYPSSLPNPLAFDVAAGAVTLSFSTPGLFNVFEQDGSFAPDFPLTSILLADLQQGPLTISFSTGIRELGFFAQGLFPDVPEAFTFNVFNGASLLNTFTAGPNDNAGLPGVALFIGARATGGDLITRLTVSNTGSSDEFFDPSFVIGPITLGEAAAAAPVPEPGTLVLLGTGLLYGARRLRGRSA